MAICMIAAVGKNLELGKGNDLIWHFKDDMAFFKETTMGSSEQVHFLEICVRKISFIYSHTVTAEGNDCR